MKVTGRAPGKITKNLKKRMGGIKIRVRIETVQTTTLMKLARILALEN